MFKKNEKRIWEELTKEFDIQYHFDQLGWYLWRNGYKITRLELEGKEGTKVVVVGK